MKKLSIILVVALLATIGFSACGNKSIKGTSWKSDVQSTPGVTTYSIFNFTTNTDCEGIYYWNNEVDGTANGTYTYNHPNVTIDLGFDAHFTGTVDGKKMTLLHEDGVTIILTKQ